MSGFITSYFYCCSISCTVLTCVCFCVCEGVFVCVLLLVLFFHCRIALLSSLVAASHGSLLTFWRFTNRIIIIIIIIMFNKLTRYSLVPTFRCFRVSVVAVDDQSAGSPQRMREDAAGNGVVDESKRSMGLLRLGRSRWDRAEASKRSMGPASGQWV